MNETVQSYNYFCIRTFEKGEKSNESTIPCFSSRGIIRVKASNVKDSKGILDKYKVVVTRAMSGGNKPNQNDKYKVTSSLSVVEPGVAVSETYLIIGVFCTKNEAENFRSYASTKVFRYLLLQALSSIEITKDTFLFVPELSYFEDWSDFKLKEYFNLSEKDMETIFSVIEG